MKYLDGIQYHFTRPLYTLEAQTNQAQSGPSRILITPSSPSPLHKSVPRSSSVFTPKTMHISSGSSSSSASSGGPSTPLDQVQEAIHPVGAEVGVEVGVDDRAAEEIIVSTIVS